MLSPLRLVIGLLLAAFPAAAEVRTGVEFAKVEGHSLRLDLHRPDGDARPPLVVYVHGGAWRSGSRENAPIRGLVKHGFAVASVDYRLSTQAIFPAQIHDIKAAIRFLRIQADEFLIDADRIAIAGSSAGGHLAALVGVTNGNVELEGVVGDHAEQSSRIDAIVSFYGASNLESILSQSTGIGLEVRVPALQLLLGALPDKVPKLARLASPVAHLDTGDPPLMLIHGASDPQMPPAQSEEFREACEAAHIPVQLIMLPGSKHGGDEFYDEGRLHVVAEFLREHLQQP